MSRSGLTRATWKVVGYSPSDARKDSRAARYLSTGSGNLQHMTTPTTLEAEPTPATGHAWTFLSNHAHALICLARDGDCRVRDLALRIGITERAVQRILADLEVAGYLVRERHGRRNHHRLVLDRPMRHPLEASHTVGELVDALLAPEARDRLGG